MQNYATWIQTALLFNIKTEDLYEDIADDVEKDVKHETGMKSPDHCLQERVKWL